MNITDMIISQLGDKVVGQVAAAAGVDPKMARSVLEKVTPAMTGAMAKNTAQEEGKQALDRALGQHGKADYENLNRETVQQKQNDGKNILGHVLGSSTGSVADVLAGQVGSDKKTTQDLMEKFAPMILGGLGQVKSDKGLGAGGLAEQLQNTAKGLSSDPNYMALAMKFLDFDKDGQVIDDLPKILGFFGIIKKFLGGR